MVTLRFCEGRVLGESFQADGAFAMWCVALSQAFFGQLKCTNLQYYLHQTTTISWKFVVNDALKHDGTAAYRDLCDYYCPLLPLSSHTASPVLSCHAIARTSHGPT